MATNKTHNWGIGVGQSKGSVTRMDEEKKQEQEKNMDPVFTIESSLGRVSIDMKAYADAKAAAHALLPKQTRQNMFDSKMFTFLNAIKTQRDSRYWQGHLGGAHEDAPRQISRTGI